MNEFLPIIYIPSHCFQFGEQKQWNMGSMRQHILLLIVFRGDY